MKKSIKFIALIVSFFMTIASMPINSVIEAEGNNSNESCSLNDNTVESEYVNDEGNDVVVYEDGVEVEYLDDATAIIRDYEGVLSSGIANTRSPRGLFAAFIAIGKAVLTIVGACSSVQYVTGHDVCRIVLKSLANPYQGTYELTGRYLNSTIPGCQPQHSQVCNGYWEYKVVRK